MDIPQAFLRLHEATLSFSKTNEKPLYTNFSEWISIPYIVASTIQHINVCVYYRNELQEELNMKARTNVRTKMKELLLITLVVCGTFGIFQLFQDNDEKAFSELLRPTSAAFSSLIFTKPSVFGSSPKTWIVDDQTEIESLLDFLQDYHVRKLKPEEINMDDEVNQFRISLSDENDNMVSIIVNENLIIQNSSLYYEVVDGPLDVEWMAHFFVSNQI